MGLGWRNLRRKQSPFGVGRVTRITAVPLGRAALFGLLALLCEPRHPSKDHNRYIRINIFLESIPPRPHGPSSEASVLGPRGRARGTAQPPALDLELWLVRVNRQGVGRVNFDF